MKARLIFLTVVLTAVVGVTGCSGSDNLSGRAGMLYFYIDT
jgi:hypothetical protein